MSFLSDAELVLGALERYRCESIAGQVPVIHQERLARIIEELDLAALVREGGLSGDRLGAFVEAYLGTTTRLHHPAYFGHQAAVPHPTGSLASLIDGFTNNPMAIYEMGPGAASIEFFVLNWMLEKIGWEPAPTEPGEHGDAGHNGGGVLTHGGSLANLTALLAARSRAAPDAWREGSPSDLAVLAPEGSHYSVARAVGILGLGQESIIHLEVDERGAVVPDKLTGAWDRAVRAGRRPFALVANACSTGVGVYDPLEPIGKFCASRGLWFHVDGAHGASALVSAKHRSLLRGVEKADSVTWDAHKMLRTPSLCAALLVRDHRALDSAFQQEASYLFHEKEQPGVDFLHRAVECTKAGLGLKVFMVLAAMGEAGLAEYVDSEYALTQEAYEYIAGQPDFECPVRPESNILCFRIAGSDREQLRIRDALNERGDFYLSSTVFGDRRYLRMVLINPESDLDDVRRCVEAVRSAAGNGA